MTKNAAVKGIWNKYAYIKQKNDYLGIENTFSKGKKQERKSQQKIMMKSCRSGEKKPFSENAEVHSISQWETEYWY